MSITIRSEKECKFIVIEFPFEPIPKQSVRKGLTKLGKQIFYTDPKIKNFEKNISILTKSQVIGKKKLTGAIQYDAIYTFPVPKSYPKWVHDAVKIGNKIYKETKPDLTDNLNKGVIDGCAPIIMKDDAMIAKVRVEKVYGKSGKILIRFKELPNVY